MQFRQEKMVKADTAAEKRKYSPCEAKRQADKARFRIRVNLGLAFAYLPALKDRLGMKSDAELACFPLDR